MEITGRELIKELIQGSELRKGIGEGEDFHYEKVQVVGSPFDVHFTYEKGYDVKQDLSTERFTAMWSFKLPSCAFYSNIEQLFREGKTVFKEEEVHEHYFGRKPYGEEREIQRKSYKDITLTLNEQGKPIVKAHNPEEIKDLDELFSQPGIKP